MGMTENAPLLALLKDTLMRYEIAAARYRSIRDIRVPLGVKDPVWNEAKAEMRLEQDRLVACWRDVIHEAMMAIPWDPKLLHQVMNAMDGFLNRAKD